MKRKRRCCHFNRARVASLRAQSESTGDLFMTGELRLPSPRSRSSRPFPFARRRSFLIFFPFPLLFSLLIFPTEFAALLKKKKLLQHFWTAEHRYLYKNVFVYVHTHSPNRHALFLLLPIASGDKLSPNIFYSFCARRLRSSLAQPRCMCT